MMMLKNLTFNLTTVNVRNLAPEVTEPDLDQLSSRMFILDKTRALVL